jgi:hypothetical protein
MGWKKEPTTCAAVAGIPSLKQIKALWTMKRAFLVLIVLLPSLKRNGSDRKKDSANLSGSSRTQRFCCLGVGLSLYRLTYFCPNILSGEAIG